MEPPEGRGPAVSHTASGWTSPFEAAPHFLLRVPGEVGGVGWAALLRLGPPPHPEEKASKMKANEAKRESDKRRLKEVLDASESRSIKLELQRRSLEGELQRSRLGLSDREAQAQALQERVDSLQRQVGPLPQLQAPLLHTLCRGRYEGM